MSYLFNWTLQPYLISYLIYVTLYFILFCTKRQEISTVRYNCIYLDSITHLPSNTHIVLHNLMHLVRIDSLENTMDNWDENPTDPVILKTISGKNKWEGEDAEEDVKDSWDQDPEDEKSEEEEAKPTPPPTKKSTKKIEEKKKKPEPEKPLKPLTPEELLAEKIRAQKLQEESDRILAKEIFGSTGLETKEDYDKFRSDIMNVVSDSVKNSNYATFAEQLIQSLCIHLSSIDLKKINTVISNLQIEKSKMEKGEKSKKSKGKGKAKLKLEGDNDYSEYSAFTEDFDDFI